jgi:hypothetical protein
MRLLAILTIAAVLAVISVGCREQTCEKGAPLRPLEGLEAPITRGGVIFLTPEQYADATSPVPSVTIEAVLVHERIHAEREVEMGCDRFERWYRGSREFRWHAERLAFEAQADYLKSVGRALTAEALREAVLDPRYRGMVDAATAEIWARSIASR